MRPGRFPAGAHPMENPMRPIRALRPAAAAVLLAATLLPGAHAQALGVTCDVNIQYLLNGTPMDTYARTFQVSEGVPYAEDFSTATRFKFFDASFARETGQGRVSISYYNDVGVFSTVQLNTSLVMRRRTGVETTSGDHTYSTSQGAAGNHETRWSLSCSRA